MPGSGQDFGVFISKDVMVSMRDGVRLAVDIYRPAAPDGAPAKGKFATILGRTSYDKTDPVMWVETVAMFFTTRGYVTVLQDLRGRGRSEGVGQYYHTANVNEGRDGYDTIKWIAEQEWSNGRVGMVGSSHNANVQICAALERPPHLSALWLDVTRINAYETMARPGGAFYLSVLGACFLHAHDMPEIRDDSAARKRIEEAVENLRELVWQAPFKRGHTALSVVPTIEEVFFNYYHRATKDEWWCQEVLDQRACMDRFADIPVTISGGWFDTNAIDCTAHFAMLARQSRSQQRLIVGPWNHYSMKGAGASHLVDAEFGAASMWGDAVYNEERLRWFDKWLKDMDTGVDDDPPARLFVMGGGSGRKTQSGHIDHGGQWRNEDEWPLSRAEVTAFYLQADGGLANAPPAAAAASLSWTHDPDHPVPTLGGIVTGFYEWVKLPEGMNRDYLPPRARMRQIIPAGPMHQREQADIVGCRPPYPLLAERADVLVFQTEPLADDIEVTGPIEVRLWVSSSARDTDFTAKLVDVYPPSADYPEGYHMGLTDSILRARFHEGFDHEAFLEPDEIYEMTIILPPTSNLFQAGHRIRVDVASSNFPRFDVNPNTGEPLGRHTGKRTARNTVHLNRDHPSHIALPVVSA